MFIKKIQAVLISGFLLFSCNVMADVLNAKYEDLSTTEQALVNAAIQARTKAYAPYSHYLVGAALLDDAGAIITGANVENASYGLTNCAERSAIFKAVSDGKRKFTAIAIVTKDSGAPCGACRQVLNEFNPNMKVITSDISKEHIQITSLSQLLPGAFGPQNLEN